MRFFLVTALLAAVLAGPAQAQDAALLARLTNCRNTLHQLGTAEGEEIEKQSKKFEELGFGAGYAAVINSDDRPKLKEDKDAEVVGGVVRVNNDNNVQFGPVLELHKFLGTLASRRLAKVGGEFFRGKSIPANCASDKETAKIPLIGVGPMAALRLGSDGEVVQSFGLGVMFGFRKDASDNSLNIGVTYVTDLNVKTLGDGINEGKPLPNGETAIRFKNTHLEGVMVLISVGW